MKITVDHPHLPKGTEVAVLSNLAVVPNGETVDVDDETIALYEAQTGKKTEEAIKNNAIMATGGDKPADKRKKAEKEAATNATTEETTVIEKGGEE